MGAGRSRPQIVLQQGVQHHIISGGGCGGWGAPAPAPAFGGWGLPALGWL